MKKYKAMMVGLLVGLAGAGALVLAEEQPYSLGDFAVRMAKMVTEKQYTEADAVKVLTGMGFALPGELDSPVSEALVVGAFNQLGANLTTTTPDQSVTRGKADNLFGMLDDQGSVENHFPTDSIKCKGGGPNENLHCVTDADCPGGYCRIPPGWQKKVSSPSDGG
jgi:hypothetical protein